MEIFTTLIICTAIFGMASIAAAFIHQLLVSRDKDLYDKAQLRAIRQEAGELTQLREQMKQRNCSGDIRCKILQQQSEDVAHLDARIAHVFRCKEKIIQKYANLAIQPVLELAEKDALPPIAEPASLQDAIKKDLNSLDAELLSLQQQRRHIWQSETGLQHDLVSEENAHNHRLDDLYDKHSTLIEKAYASQADVSGTLAAMNMRSSSEIFSNIIRNPLQVLKTFLFQRSRESTFDTSQQEVLAVKVAEEDINNEFALESNNHAGKSRATSLTL